jgi:transcription initiation factor TFIID subunit 11
MGLPANINLSRLVSSFTLDQDRRFNLYRASKINMSVLRRIVNQTVSQSVAKNPLLAVSTYTKFFAGEIIERAREVQIEWAKAYDKVRNIEKQQLEEQLKTLNVESGTQGEAESRLRARKIETLTQEIKRYRPNPHQGGLLPDHLREALRRYKGDGEGGGVGFGSLSHGLVGVQGAGTWRVGQGNAGRRLFR